VLDALAPAVPPPSSGKIVEVVATIDCTALGGIAKPAVVVT